MGQEEKFTGVDIPRNDTIVFVQKIRKQIGAGCIALPRAFPIQLTSLAAVKVPHSIRAGSHQSAAGVSRNGHAVLSLCSRGRPNETGCLIIRTERSRLGYRSQGSSGFPVARAKTANCGKTGDCLTRVVQILKVQPPGDVQQWSVHAVATGQHDAYPQRVVRLSGIFVNSLRNRALSRRLATHQSCLG